MPAIDQAVAWTTSQLWQVTLLVIVVGVATWLFSWERERREAPPVG